jgi:hypothetical protein
MTSSLIPSKSENAGYVKKVQIISSFKMFLSLITINCVCKATRPSLMSGHSECPSLSKGSVHNHGKLNITWIQHISNTNSLGTHWHVSRVVCSWSPSTRLKSSCYQRTTIFFVNKQVELFLMLQFPD